MIVRQAICRRSAAPLNCIDVDMTGNLASVADLYGRLGYVDSYLSYKIVSATVTTAR
jgi:hypothetical protein